MTAYTIYGKENCTYCDQAKALLESRELAYQYFDIMTDLDKRNEMFSRVRHQITTVPQIMHGDAYVGGYTELAASLAD